jgi:hypothetical protein
VKNGMILCGSAGLFYTGPQKRVRVHSDSSRNRCCFGNGAIIDDIRHWHFIRISTRPKAKIDGNTHPAPSF